MALKEVIPRPAPWPIASPEGRDLALEAAKNQTRGPSPPSGMLRDRFARSGRQTTAARSGRRLSSWGRGYGRRISGLRAFEPKADPSPPSGILRDRSAHSGWQAKAKSRSFGL